MLAISRAVQLLAGFVVTLLVAGHLGPAGLGVYSTAWAFYGLVSLAAQGGAREFVVRELSRDPGRTSHMVVHLTVLGAVAAMALTGVGIALTRIVGYPPEVALSVLVVLLGTPAKVISTIFEAVFLAHGRSDLEAKTRAFTSGLFVAVGAVVLAEGASIATLLTVFVATEFLAAIGYLVLLAWKITPPRTRFRIAHARQLAGDIRPYAASASLAALFSRPEIIILSLVASQSQVGLYGAATRLIDVPIMLVEVFHASVFPLLARSFGTDERRFAAVQTKSLRLVIAFAALVLAMACAVPAQILTLMYGSGFADADTVLRLLAVNVLVFAVIGILWRTLVARGLQAQNVRLQMISVAVRLSAGFALAAPFAAIGAAVSNVLGSAVHLVLLHRAAARASAPVRLPRSAIGFLAAALVGGGVSVAVGGSLPVVVTLVAGTVAYAVTVVAVRALTPADLSDVLPARLSRMSSRRKS